MSPRSQREGQGRSSDTSGKAAIAIACISAIATLGGAYIAKLDFNTAHKGIDQEVSSLGDKVRKSDDTVAALRQAAAREVKPAPETSDGSCEPLLAGKARDQSGRAYAFELTMHREAADLVTYSVGSLQAMADGSFAGSANQLFSDRKASSGQPFNVAAADQLDLTLAPTGLLRIRYKTWNFDTTWALSCRGSLMTAYLPGFGVVTLTFRN